MLIPFIAKLTKISMRTHQTLIDKPFDIPNSTCFTNGSFVNSEPFLPLFQIIENSSHWVVELGPAHGASHRLTMILLVPDPHFQTFTMHAFMTCWTRGIALSDHILVAYGTSFILIQRREIICCLIPFMTLHLLLRLEFADILFLFLLHVLELDKSLQLWVQVRSWIWEKLHCQIMALFSGTLYFFNMTYRVWIQWSFSTTPHEQLTRSPITTWMVHELLWIYYHFHPWKGKMLVPARSPDTMSFTKPQESSGLLTGSVCSSTVMTCSL